MYKRRVIVLTLLSFVWIAQAMAMDVEQHRVHPFFELPTELCSLIMQVSLDAVENVYAMHNTRSSERLHIPYTLRPINPVIVTTQGDPRPSSWQPKVGEEVLLDHQLWFQSDESRIRLCEDTADNNDCFDIERSGFSGFTTFDGINKKRSAIFAISDATQSEFFLLRQSASGAGTVKNAEKVSGFGCYGQFYALMLHPDENRILCSWSCKQILDAQAQVRDENTEYVVVASQLPYSLSIGDIADDNTFTKIAEKAVAVLVDKTVYLGANNYVGFTTTGKLIRIWLDDANTIQYALQNIVRYDEHTKSYVRSDSVIKDIAVDDSYRTEDGKRTHLAYVTNEGEVFVIDLGSFVNSTPMLNTVLSAAADIFRLFYDKGQLAVLYRDKHRKFSDFIVWSDNLGPLYLKTVLRQQVRGKDAHV